MRRYAFIILLFIACLCFYGCDINIPKKGNSFKAPNSRWVSTNPDMVLDIDNENQCLTTLNIDGKDEKVTILFGPGAEATAYLPISEGEYNYDERLFSASTENTDKEYTLNITYKKDGVLEGIDKIVFTRDDTTEQ